MSCRKLQHQQHAFTDFHPLEREGFCVFSRRNMLKASFAGLGGLSLPGLQQLRADASRAGQPLRQKSVI
ncbi:MAG: hypothetical protein KDA78_18210, partial [Planctomycetaceae bacterium]|nr:hypothetical protein [Planctomycetaceae bacterium]